MLSILPCPSYAGGGGLAGEGGSSRGRGSREGGWGQGAGGLGGGGRGHFIYSAIYHILHYHMVLRPKGTSHDHGVVTERLVVSSASTWGPCRSDVSVSGSDVCASRRPGVLQGPRQPQQRPQ